MKTLLESVQMVFQFAHAENPFFQADKLPRFPIITGKTRFEARERHPHGAAVGCHGPVLDGAHAHATARTRNQPGHDNFVTQSKKHGFHRENRMEAGRPRAGKTGPQPPTRWEALRNAPPRIGPVCPGGVGAAQPAAGHRGGTPPRWRFSPVSTGKRAL
jgi:hypothetical protein